MKPRPPLPSDPPGGSGRSRLGSPGLPVCRSVGVAGGAGYLYGNGYGSAPPAGDFPQWLGSGVGGGALSRAEPASFFFWSWNPLFSQSTRICVSRWEEGVESASSPWGQERSPAPRCRTTRTADTTPTVCHRWASARMRSFLQWRGFVDQSIPPRGRHRTPLEG